MNVNPYLILNGDCVDTFSDEAVRATMGSVFAVSISKCTAAEFVAWRQSWPGSVIGTRLDATHGYREAAIQKPAWTDPRITIHSPTKPAVAGRPQLAMANSSAKAANLGMVLTTPP